MFIQRLLFIAGLLALAACSTPTDPDPPGVTSCSGRFADPTLPNCGLPNPQ